LADWFSHAKEVVNAYKTILLIFAITACLGCKNEELVTPPPTPNAERSLFGVDRDHILKDDQPFEVKGVVYVPGYPGYLPWEIERSENLPDFLRKSIDQDLLNIQAMGANTVRLWGAPTYCYEALKKMDGFYFIQTIWIDGEVPDFQSEVFKEGTKKYIEEVIDRIYSVFEESPPLIAYLVGNELSESSIHSTDSRHPEITHFTGNFIATDSTLTATEAFLAEMADHVKTYEYTTYGITSLVSYANDIRTVDIIKTSFLDFTSHNAYSYAVPYYRPGTTPGSSSGTSFQGWIEEIKLRQIDQPLLITETGLSVSPNAFHVGPPDYGYGGNTTEEQATGLLQNLDDIETASVSIAGVCIHEYVDAWWKFGLEDSYSQDPNDIEEWFGIAKLEKSDNWYTTAFRPAYHALKERWTSN
jgi:hypothetical protein